MKLSEVFYSIQGEGLYTGVPSVFIRTFGCNLFCRWCDSKFSNEDTSERFDVSVDEIINDVQKYINCNHVVITGGEPLLQHEELVELVNKLQKKKYFVTIETNGTKYYKDLKPNLWSISPKTSNSFELNQDELNDLFLDHQLKLHQRNNNLDNLYEFVKSKIPCQFKFVVSDKNDLDEMEQLVKDHGIQKDTVQLMPEGKTAEFQRSKSLEVVELCKERGYTFCTRLHIYLWGELRGV